MTRLWDTDFRGKVTSLCGQMEEAANKGPLILRINGIPLTGHSLPQGSVRNKEVRQDDVNKWLADINAGFELVYPYAGNDTKPLAALSNQPATESPAETVKNGVVVPAWNLTKPSRIQGYAKPLFLLLQAAHISERSRPTAREVIDAFAVSKPDEIAQLLPNGFDYYDAKGNTKGASLDAISESIRRMTSERPL